jgi:lysophospholipase L1-like esterase
VTLTLAVLGDSIAYGQGATRSTDTIGSRLAAALTAAGTPTEPVIFALPGARSDALAAQAARASAAEPDIALIIIGANDLTHFVPPQQAARLLGDAVSMLRAGGAQVVVTPAPDLSVIPWLPVQLRSAVRTGSAMLRQAQTQAALAAGARVVNLDAAVAARFAADASLFSPDHFHPSSAGYALITKMVTPAVEAAAAEVARR